MRTALDWETVTPLGDIPPSSISNRLERGLRRWKHNTRGGPVMNPTVAAEHARASPGSVELSLAPRSRSQVICPPGSVLLHAPSFAFQAPGGGENQLVQTGRHLEAMGIPVRLFSPGPTASKRPGCSISSGCLARGSSWRGSRKSRGLPVVLSPICWYEPLALAALETDLVRKLASLAVWGFRLVAPRIPSWRRELLNLADLVLPNSLSEAAQFVRLFGVARERIRVVPNGVLPTVASASPESVSGAVGCGSVRPLRGPDRAAQEYARRWSAPFDRWVCRWWSSARPHPAFRRLRPRLPRAGWGSCRLAGTARPSRSAAGLGLRRGQGLRAAKLVRDARIGRARGRARRSARRDHPYGSTRDYFGDLVEYARPDRPGEIRRAVAKCWEDGPDPRLSRLDRDSLSLAERGPDHRGGL